MTKTTHAERILLEEISKQATLLEQTLRNQDIADFIKIIRRHLKMSQSALAKRAHVPQSSISRIEKGYKTATLSTLYKIFEALSCDMVIAPRLRAPIETIRQSQAKKIAKKRTRYLQGTMNLEKQEPNQQLLQEITKQTEQDLLQGNGSSLWKDE